MLIIRQKNLCLKKCLNIFYKYEHDVLTMGYGGNYNGTTHMEIKDLEDEYVKFLQDLPVSEMANRPQRYTFLNMTISLLEVLIKNEIATTESVVMRSKTKTLRYVNASHNLSIKKIIA